MSYLYILLYIISNQELFEKFNSKHDLHETINLTYTLIQDPETEIVEIYPKNVNFRYQF